MELAYNETLGPVANENWATITDAITGPGVFVFLINCALNDTSTMHVQVLLDAESAGTLAVVEDFTSVATDLTTVPSGWAGFQSSPVPLVDASWVARVRAEHDDGVNNHSFTLRVIKL